MAVNPDKLKRLDTHVRLDQDEFIRNYVAKRKEKEPAFSKGDLIREIIDLWIKGEQITLDDILS